MSSTSLQFDTYYHIYNRGNNRENLFVEERNYPYFMKLYTRHILPVAETFAYCLMPNHFHFLIRTRSEEEQRDYQFGSISKNRSISKSGIKSLSLKSSIDPRQPSRAFNNMFIAYTRAFNRATGRTGVLFERPFHRKPVTKDAYFHFLVVYIHKNPEKHGFVGDFREWKWSSYTALHSNQITHLAREAVFDWFGNLETFDDYHMRSFEEGDISHLIDDDKD